LALYVVEPFFIGLPDVDRRAGDRLTVEADDLDVDKQRFNALHGGLRNADTKNLQAFAKAVREHVEKAARVVSAIRVLVTPHKDKA
jgi:hypothetical protein